MKFKLLDVAKLEYAESADWYNDQRAGLGEEFIAAVEHAFDRIEQFPFAWSNFSPRTRRCFVTRFPHGILYAVRGETIVVLAIMHLKRDPVAWQAREGLL